MAYPYVSDHEVRVLSKYFGDPTHRRVDTYVERGGYKALKKAFELGPEKVVYLNDYDVAVVSPSRFRVNNLGSETAQVQISEIEPETLIEKADQIRVSRELVKLDCDMALDTPLEELDDTDFAAFRALNDLPMGMTAHLILEADLDLLR